MSTVTSTPRKDGKTEAEGRADMGRRLEEYNIVNEHDGTENRGTEAKNPSTGPVSPKTKKPATRKRNATTPNSTTKSSASSSSQESESSPSRKSKRIAAGIKRSVKAIDNDDTESVKPSPAKKLKLKATTTANATPSKKVQPAVTQQLNGFTPINAQKKVEKRPADFDEAEAKPKKRTKKVTGPAQLPDAAVAADMIQMGSAAADEDSNETDEADNTPIKGKGKAKAKAKFKAKAKKSKAPDIDYTPNNQGSSVEKPANAPNNEFWNCANRSCNSGQTWHNRDGDKGVGRKVVSHFLGRNKKETTSIAPDVWHTYCRKCYQRGHYAANKDPKRLCEFFTSNIEEQLKRIETWRPEAKFKVRLMTGAVGRLNTYYKELSNNRNDEVKAEQEVAWLPTDKKKTPSLEDIFPIKKMKEFDDTFCKSTLYGFTGLKTILDWTRKQVGNGSIETMPPMELLINKMAAGEKTTDPKESYRRWTAALDGLDYDKPVSTVDQAAVDEAESDSVVAESVVAGSSGTQDQDQSKNDIEVEASEAGDATNEQAIDEGGIPDYESYVAETPQEELFSRPVTQGTDGAQDDGEDGLHTYESSFPGSRYAKSYYRLPEDANKYAQDDGEEYQDDGEEYQDDGEEYQDDGEEYDGDGDHSDNDHNASGSAYERRYHRRGSLPGDYTQEDGEEHYSEGEEYSSDDSEPEEDDDDKPMSPRTREAAFAKLIASRPFSKKYNAPLATTIGLLHKGKRVISVEQRRINATRQAALDAISPLTPTAPMITFTSPSRESDQEDATEEVAGNEAEQQEATEEVAATEGAEGGA